MIILVPRLFLLSQTDLADESRACLYKAGTSHACHVTLPCSHECVVPVQRVLQSQSLSSLALLLFAVQACD